MSLNIPTTHTPPWILLCLALFQDVEVKWDAESGEKGQITYNGITGTEAVRAELEKGIPGKEVSWLGRAGLITSWLFSQRRDTTERIEAWRGRARWT